MLAGSLAFQFGFSARALSLNLEGITDEESRVRPAAGGNSINWLVGHIVSYRQVVLELLGESPVWPKERTDAYGRGSNGDVQDDLRLPVDGLLDALKSTTAVIVPLLEALSDEAMAAQPPGLKQPLGQRLAFLAFHESYHVGQVGLARRLLGKPGAIR
jgi:uncharacterized damage-inducible protein DinB